MEIAGSTTSSLPSLRVWTGFGLISLGIEVGLFLAVFGQCPQLPHVPEAEMLLRGRCRAPCNPRRLAFAGAEDRT